VVRRTLPVNEPQRLAQITRLLPNGRPGVVSFPVFEFFRAKVWMQGCTYETR